MRQINIIFALLSAVCPAAAQMSCFALGPQECYVQAVKVYFTNGADAAQPLLERACLEDEPRACALLANHLEFHKKQYAMAFTHYHFACSHGVLSACANAERMKVQKAKYDAMYFAN